MRTLALALLVAGCSGRSGPKDPGTTDSTSTPPISGTPTGGGTVALSCAAQPDHLLRYDCLVTTSIDEPVTLSWGLPDDPEEHRATSTGGTTHALVVWGVRPELAHTVTATTPSGEASIQITPSALPAEWLASWTSTGQGSSDAILVADLCAPTPTALLLDDHGRPIGYQSFEGTGLNGVSWTRDGTYLAMTNRSIVTEFDLLGNQLLRLSAADGDFQGPAHHEAHRGPNGITWILTARPVVQGPDTFVLDVVLGVDPSGAVVAEWAIQDHLIQPLDPSVEDGPPYWAGAFPNGIDYTHANAVWADEAGDLYLSFRKIHTVFKIVGDPGAPDFGDVIWRMTGGAFAAEPSDFAITSSNGATPTLDFDGQHAPHVGSDGRLALFDNRRDLGPVSRGLLFELDPASGIADIVEAYPMPAICTNQGSVYPTATGNRLIACSDEHLVFEYAQGAASPSWTVESACDRPFYRAFPVELPIELP